MRRSFVTGLGLAFVLCACSTTADSTEAGVRLTVTRDSGLSLDALRIAAFDGDREVVTDTIDAPDGTLSESETAPLVFAGAPDGAEVRIEVEGLSGGDVLATGEATVTLELGTFVDAEVHLGGEGGGGDTDGGTDGGGISTDGGGDSEAGTDAGGDAGATDCDEGDTRPCGSTDVGECTFGTETCTGGVWGACVGDVQAADEACPADGKDQDCNGTDDDGDNSCGGVCTLSGEPSDWCDASGDPDTCPDDRYECDGLNAVDCVEDTPGLVRWATSIGTNAQEQGYGIAAADDGSLFMTGSTQGTGGGTVDFGGIDVPAFGFSDVVVARIDPDDGGVLWAAAGGGTNVDLSRDVAAEPDGSAAYVVGRYNGSAMFGTETLNGGGYDYFLVKYDGSSGGDTTGDVSWAVDAGGSGSDAGQAVAIGPDGSVYVTGYVQNGINDDIDFGLNAADIPVVLTRPCNGGAQLFVAKYSAAGETVWVAGTAADPARTSDAVYGEGIDVDDAGNVYVTGSFVGLGVQFCDADQTRFCPETLCTPLTSQDMSGGSYSSDAFVAKYNQNGDLQWVARAGHDSEASAEFEQGVDLATDGTTVYVTGWFDGGEIAFCTNPDPPGACAPAKVVSSVGSRDTFIAAYDAVTGAFEWARGVGASGEAVEVDGIALAFDGSLRLSGSMQGTAGFGLPAEDCYTPLTSEGSTSNDVFLARFESNGDLRWVRRAGGTDADNAWGMAVMSDGDSVVTGYFNGTAAPYCHDPTGCTTSLSTAGTWDVFVARFAP